MTTIAVLTVLSPVIIVGLIVAAGALTVWFALFIARVVFWLAIGGLIGLALWASEARAEQHADLLRLNFNVPCYSINDQSPKQHMPQPEHM